MPLPVHPILRKGIHVEHTDGTKYVPMSVDDDGVWLQRYDADGQDQGGVIWTEEKFWDEVEHDHRNASTMHPPDMPTGAHPMAPRTGEGQTSEQDHSSGGQALRSDDVRRGADHQEGSLPPRGARNDDEQRSGG